MEQDLAPGRRGAGRDQRVTRDLRGHRHLVGDRPRTGKVRHRHRRAPDLPLQHDDVATGADPGEQGLAPASLRDGVRVVRPVDEHVQRAEPGAGRELPPGRAVRRQPRGELHGCQEHRLRLAEIVPPAGPGAGVAAQLHRPLDAVGCTGRHEVVDELTGAPESPLRQPGVEHVGGARVQSLPSRRPDGLRERFRDQRVGEPVDPGHPRFGTQQPRRGGEVDRLVHDVVTEPRHLLEQVEVEGAAHQRGGGEHLPGVVAEVGDPATHDVPDAGRHLHRGVGVASARGEQRDEFPDEERVPAGPLDESHGGRCVEVVTGAVGDVAADVVRAQTGEVEAGDPAGPREGCQQVGTAPGIGR